MATFFRLPATSRLLICLILLMSLILRRAEAQHAGQVIRDPDIPIIERPATIQAPDQPILVGISGDGGWKGFIDNFCIDFTKRGIPAAGVDALHYFWNEKNPDVTAADLASVIRLYLQKWNRQSFILMGYSFGASVMPFVVNRLPPDLKRRLKMVVLLSPSRYADFQFHFSSWMNETRSRTYLVLPEMEKMRAVRTLVFYGQEESQKPTLSLSGNLLKTIAVAGDHHYHNDHALMSGIVLKEL